uniref:Integrase_H2C2 domain-containing protein n=1 Tax=Onchocerca volvulus TaxID=6282 RepID=A0A8R1XP54_ONCVO
MIRATIRALKFLKLLSKNKFPWLNHIEGNLITSYEYEFALKLLIRQAQSEGLTAEEMQKYNLHYTNDFWQFIHRLQIPDKRKDVSYAIYLPRYNKITELIIQHYHEEMLHAGIAHTISELRKLYWIPKGRTEVKRVLNKCTRCKRWKAKPFKLPPMPNYPESRIKPSRTFARIGLDYLGPITVKTEIGSRKRWIALFTCCTTRAVHLELVNDLAAESFLNALRRFQTINEQDSQLTDFLTKQGMVWNNNIPKAPWSGGIYERIIGITKNALRKAIGRKLLKEKESDKYSICRSRK